MARVAMVTRTIITAEVQVLCMNVETVAVETQTVTLLGGIASDDIMLKKIKEQIESETIKPVHIQSAKEIETLYGMTEAEFVQLAKALPPRTKASEPEAPVTEEEITK
jgi:hypothetical protein